MTLVEFWFDFKNLKSLSFPVLYTIRLSKSYSQGYVYLDVK